MAGVRSAAGVLRPGSEALQGYSHLDLGRSFDLFIVNDQLVVKVSSTIFYDFTAPGGELSS